jgi:signal transduction histidine kinase
MNLAVAWDGPVTALLVTDAQLAGEIFRNLFLNAAQAGATTLAIRVRPGDPFTIEVEDDGAGIADPESVFDWFHTTRAGGSGLGLPIARRLATALEGRLLMVAAGPATFRLELPGGDP